MKNLTEIIKESSIQKQDLSGIRASKKKYEITLTDLQSSLVELAISHAEDDLLKIGFTEKEIDDTTAAIRNGKEA